MKIISDIAEKEIVIQVAKQMLTAARTAPKAHGDDSIVALALTDEDKDALALRTKELGEEYKQDFMIRDSKMIKHCHAVVLIGVKDETAGVGKVCQFCGFENCGKAMKAGADCALKVTDLGIAVGSAVSIAADNRIDNRVFFSAGKAALTLGLLGENVKLAYAIPLGADGKSVFFDRISSPQLADLQV
ncbi:MAG: DUF2148 domain-containing protein [Anaerovoracaceae bacterium]